MTKDPKSSGRVTVPPIQQNFQTAVQKAILALSGQSPEQMVWLGAAGTGQVWELPVLDGVLRVDISTGKVCTSDNREVSRWWRVLVLHYLAIRDHNSSGLPEIVFGDIPSARTYAGIYHQRVIARLCRTAGRDAQTLRHAAEALSARFVDAGDMAFDLDVLPRLSVRVIWYAGDDELPPSATLLLPGRIEAFFCTEDIVVLSESVVSRLSGCEF